MQDKRHMRKKLKRLNAISSNIYVIHLEGNDVVSNMHVIDGSQVVDLVEATTTEVILGNNAFGYPLVGAILLY